jgi:PAS domain S-box-containing protein
MRVDGKPSRPAIHGPLDSQRYRRVFDLVHDIIYVRDLEGVILDINDAGSRFFGLPKETLIGKTLHRSTDDQAAQSLKSTNDLLMRNGVDRSTVELPNSAGEIRIVESTTTLIQNDDGTPLGACGVMRDVTEAIIAQRVLADDNARKTQELEEARLLQLSLLPKQLPQLPFVEIAVQMRNATEVGGDYYDFGIADDGALTIALGDATGHGLKAGILGATAKSYFHTLSKRSAPRDILETLSAAFRNLGLPSVYMCLLLLRIHDRQVSIVSAGMPSFLVRPRDGRAIQRVEVAGTPLGARRDPTFGGKVLDFDRGTTMLLFSDGLPELLDASDRELGYERIQARFAEAGNQPVAVLVASILALADEWRGDRPAEDDLTVMAVRAV